jgi:UDPglucose--hexose-1-phosphate uridylyltransferase
MSELRYDPIRKTWVIIATERGMRPTDIRSHGQAGLQVSRAFCPFCLGNEDRTPPEILAVRKPGAQPNGPGWKIRVVPNKFPVLTTETPQHISDKGIYKVAAGFGTHEVIVETPSDVQQMADFNIAHLSEVFAVYQSRLIDLERDERFRSVMIFKNYGSAAGASLRHSHSQVIAIPVMPNLLELELAGAHDYYLHKKRCIMCDIILRELADGERIVIDEDLFVAFTPFASSFPFELRITSKNHNHDFTLLDNNHLHHLAEIIKDVLVRLRDILEDPPYNLILHTGPPVREHVNNPDYLLAVKDSYHWYFELIPRMTTIAGFEWGTGFQINPTSPEDAARFLRETEI